MKKSSLLVVGALAFASAASPVWALGVKTGQTGTTTINSEQGHESSNKASMTAGGIVLLNSTLGSLGRVNFEFIKHGWYYAKPIKGMIAGRLGVDPVFYAERRAELLGASQDAFAQYVGGLYRNCGADEACITSLVKHEVIALGIQSPGFAQQVWKLKTNKPGAAPEGYEDIGDKDGDNYLGSAVSYTYAANYLGKRVTDIVPATAPMSLAQRGFELGKAYMALSDADLDAAFPSKKWRINYGWWKVDGPLTFQVEGFGAFSIDLKDGVTVTQGGALLYGQGNMIDGRKVEYTDEASGSVKQTKSKSNASTTSTEKTTIY
ncbi:hypothetical protein [Quatrionicoccus australiensis]|uniref:hypothetical protein n=1 Tax=Quatrionicoccus australiensis TaxID=138118 RepID=UPI001CF98731|nr:hypothetical protein [Quatrionicoccus australiensis]MCB4359574.1 hypothetical protein [Quatrionicoccus australiensis]